MEDSKIVDLYWARDEAAIRESDRKYGKMLHALSYSLLSSREDAEECVSDTYLDAWHAIPPARPVRLGAFLSKITRRISIDRYRAIHNERRGGVDNLCAELTECIPDTSTVGEEYESRRLREELNSFLYSCSREKRAMFILRYFHSMSTADIAARLSVTESKVKTTLHRMRRELQNFLEEQELLRKK